MTEQNLLPEFRDSDLSRFLGSDHTKFGICRRRSSDLQMAVGQSRFGDLIHGQISRARPIRHPPPQKYINKYVHQHK